MNVHDASHHELADWDTWTVDRPGGHVYQSRAWAEHRRTAGWMPRFLVTDDGGRTLALIRAWPAIGGGSAYLPRGPAGVDAGAVARRQIAVAEALAQEGIDVVAADPEIPAADDAYTREIRAADFRPIEEIQPSRHRVSLALVADSDEHSVFEGIARSTRQRIRGAIGAGLAVVRHDTRPGDNGAGEGFDRPMEPAAAALDRFYDFLLETGERRRFSFGPRARFIGWWLAAHAAGHLVYLEARVGDTATGEPLAGLVLYRHGGRFSTVHSGDHAAARVDHPGALHLLRWRAIQLAVREGCTEMDLGGVDVAGARREPREGEPLYGLYQHKRAFGGRWLELSGAHERVFDARGYTFGRLTARFGRLTARLATVIGR